MLFFENLHRFKSKLFNTSKIDLNGKINFGDQIANDFFVNKLKKSKFYFEYGSGSSTIFADKLKKSFISVELDKSFYKKIREKLKRNNIKYFSMGPVGEFSYPIMKNKKKIINYVESINPFFKEKKFPDFILIDGRFRVACCLNLLKFLISKKSNIVILLDDFKKRQHYQILYKYYFIKPIGRMALLKPVKKKFDKSIYNQYLFDPR